MKLIAEINAGIRRTLKIPKKITIEWHRLILLKCLINCVRFGDPICDDLYENRERLEKMFASSSDKVLSFISKSHF